MSKRAYYYLSYLAISAIYVISSLLAPLGPNRFNLTASKTHLLQLTILLPVVLIWFAAVYGVEKFHTYTSSIKSYKDGKPLHLFATGLLILVGSIIFNSIVGILRPWALADGWLSAYTILANYLSAWLPLLAYACMYIGSAQLLKSIKTKPKIKNPLGWLPILLLLIIVGAIYVAVLLNYNYRSSTPDPTRYSSFYMSDPLILFTLALPYLFGWGLALKATLNLYAYLKQVRGVIYRSAFVRLLSGVLVVTLFYIIVQMLVAFSTYIAKAGLGSILLILYMLIMLYALGFLIIASGAKKLVAIEKVT